MRVLVTGANGFTGRVVIAQLEATGFQVRALVRKSSEKPDSAAETVCVGDIGPDTQWGIALDGVEAVVHLAARVHRMRSERGDEFAAYRRVNTGATANLTRQAAAHGVRRLVFLSSAKVNGEGMTGRAYTESDLANPEDPYSVSKWEAERELAEIALRSGLEVAILRPPLVYGPGVKANFLRLLGTVQAGWPLPLGAIDNRRSFVYVGNLASAITACLKHPGAVGKTYLVSDGEDISTPELVRRLAREMDVPARLLPVPPSILRSAAVLLGRRAIFDRLCGDFSVDSGAIRRELGWTPPWSMAQGLAETARWYRSLSGAR
ncbi:MAG: UDP-glucose 4-epimerase family protein [Burkholderiales bacterium]